MVRFFLPVLVMTALVVAGFASPNAKRDAAAVITDLTNMGGLLNLMSDDLSALSQDCTLESAQNVHQDSLNIISVLQTATIDVSASCPLDQDDGSTILNIFYNLQCTLVNVVSLFLAIPSCFATLPMNESLEKVQEDLIYLHANATAFGNALVACAPASLAPQYNTTNGAVESLFRLLSFIYGQ